MRLHGSGVTFTFGVPASVDECVTVTSEDRAAITATAMRSEPDTSDYQAVKISTRLLDTYGADGYPMRGHAS